jgi:hypothetical protein
VAEQRISAVLAAGGAVVDDSNAPSLTVFADGTATRESSASTCPLPGRLETQLA